MLKRSYSLVLVMVLLMSFKIEAIVQSSMEGEYTCIARINYPDGSFAEDISYPVKVTVIRK